MNVSTGGLFGALFRALTRSNIGFEGSIVETNDILKGLFGEITARYLISVDNEQAFIELAQNNDLQYKKLGICVGDKISFDGYNFDAKELFDLYKNALELEMQS